MRTRGVGGTRLPDAASLLAELEPLRHGEQARRMALLGRDARDDPHLDVLLRGLGADAWAWRLRIVAATAARRRVHILEALSCSQGSVRVMAMRRLRTVGIDAGQLPDALGRLPTPDRLVLLRSVGRGCLPGGTALPDACVDAVRERFGTHEATWLLAGCSATTVAELLLAPDDGLTWAHSIGLEEWRHIALRHPGVVLTYAEDVLAPSATGPNVFWHRLSTAFPVLARHDPDAILSLCERSGPLVIRSWNPHRLLPDLVRLRPRRTLDWLLHHTSPSIFAYCAPRLGPVLHRCDDVALCRVAAELKGYTAVLANLLGALPASLRALPFAAATSDATRIGPRMLLRALDMLPETARGAQARRLLADADVRDEPKFREQLTERLTLDERWDALWRATDADAPDDRTTSRVRLIEAIGHSSSTLPGGYSTASPVAGFTNATPTYRTRDVFEDRSDAPFPSGDDRSGERRPLFRGRSTPCGGTGRARRS